MMLTASKNLKSAEKMINVKSLPYNSNSKPSQISKQQQRRRCRRLNRDNEKQNQRFLSLSSQQESMKKEKEEEDLKKNYVSNNRSREVSISSQKSFRFILAFIGCVIYSNSLGGNFVYDDRRVILENDDVVGPYDTFSSWLRPFSNDFWGTPISNKGSHKSYRPLVILTFKLQVVLQRQFTSGSSSSATTETNNAQLPLNPIAFHLVNLLLHLIFVDLIFQLISSETFTSILLSRAISTGGSEPVMNHQRRRRQQVINDDKQLLLVGRLSALLFACHPIHVEAVTSIVGRAELMGSIFCLLSFRNLATYYYYLLNSKPTTRYYLLRSALYAIATFFCKENHSFSVLALNGLLVFWFVAVSFNSRKSQVVSAANGFHLQVRADKDRATSRWAVKQPLMVLTLLTIFYCALRRLIVTSDGDLMPKFSLIDQPLQADAKQFCLKFNQQQSANICLDEQYLKELQTKLSLTWFCLPALNLAHLLMPISLSYDWSLDSIGLIEHICDWRFLAAVLTYFALLWFGISWFYSRFLDTYLTFSRRNLNQNAALEDVHQSKDQQQAIQCQAAHDSEPESDSSSVKSVSTTKSIDSGIVDCDTASAAIYYQKDAQSKRSQPSKRLQQKPFKSHPSQSSVINLEQTIPIEERTTNSLGWSLILLLVPLIPTSNLLFWTGFIIAERTLYLPSVGFCLFAANILVYYLHPRRVWLENILVHFKSDHDCNEKKMSLQLLLKLRSSKMYKFGISSALIFENLKISSFFSHSSSVKSRSGSQPPRSLAAAIEARTTKTTKPERKIEKNSKGNHNNKRIYHETSQQHLLLFVFIFPLLIWYSNKTIDRNWAWLDEESLYSSNLVQSPAKSLANLASLKEHSSNGNYYLSSREQLYRLALTKEPLSADLHYNLARSLHERAAIINRVDEHDEEVLEKEELERKKTTTSRGTEEQQSDEVSYHYKLALKLRGENFPLAALNLGSYQYTQLNQLDKALETFQLCSSDRMASDRSKTQRQHVRVKIECLISGAKLRLLPNYSHFRGEEEKTKVAADCTNCAALKGPAGRVEAPSNFASGKQTNNIHDDDAAAAAAAAENCSKVLELMHKAKSMLLSTIVGGSDDDDERSLLSSSSVMISDELEQLGDSARQMALIHWLKGKCLLADKDKENEFRLAVGWADRSQVSLGAQIYLDYADLSGMFSRQTSGILLNSIQIEQKKLLTTDGRQPGGGGKSSIEQLAKLHYALAKVQLKETKEEKEEDKGTSKEENNREKKEKENKLELASKQMDEAIRLKPDEFNFLSFGAQLAFDLGQPKKSERLYLGALKLLQRRNKYYCNAMTQRKQHQQQQQQNSGSNRLLQLAQAHTNYGAILQVNGRLEEARQQYRKALDCDPKNTIASRNSARLG